MEINGEDPVAIGTEVRTGPQVVIVTGLSGSGKSTALAVFEDLGFLTIDGLPAAFAAPFVTMFVTKTDHYYRGLALGMDLRQTDFYRDYNQLLTYIRSEGITVRILFLEAKDDVLIKRYATTRRPHPLQREGLGLEQALGMERNRLQKLRTLADLVIDTSSHSIHDLRRVLQDKWKILGSLVKALRIHLITFGFKYGTPTEADMVFDLRFLPNPYFNEKLQPLSGCDEEVRRFVLEQEPGKEFFVRLYDFLTFVFDRYEVEGRYRLTIAIGCTGGRHRSVAVAEALAQALRNAQFSLTLEHRHLVLG